MLDQAKAVFVGTVSQSRQIPIPWVKGVNGHEVAVRPLQAIKAALPSQLVTVRDIAFTDCATMTGGGSATTANQGDYVIVFAGLPTNAFQGANVGILAKEAQLPELLAALSKFGLSNRK